MYLFVMLSSPLAFLVFGCCISVFISIVYVGMMGVLLFYFIMSYYVSSTCFFQSRSYSASLLMANYFSSESAKVFSYHLSA